MLATAFRERVGQNAVLDPITAETLKQNLEDDLFKQLDVMSDNHLGRCRQPPWPVGLNGNRACPSGGQPHRPD